MNFWNQSYPNFRIFKHRESVDFICVEVQRSLLKSCSFLPSGTTFLRGQHLTRTISDYPTIPRLRRLCGSYLEEYVICAGGKPGVDVGWEPCQLCLLSMDVHSSSRSCTFREGCHRYKLALVHLNKIVHIMNKSVPKLQYCDPQSRQRRTLHYDIHFGSYSENTHY